jgi:hypothetical protein
VKLPGPKTAISKDINGISFPKLESWNGETKMATIVAQIGKQRILCRISQKTLRDQFGAAENKTMQLLGLHRFTIQAAARRIIENKTYEDDGSILIHARDLS